MLMLMSKRERAFKAQPKLFEIPAFLERLWKEGGGGGG